MTLAGANLTNIKGVEPVGHVQSDSHSETAHSVVKELRFTLSNPWFFNNKGHSKSSFIKYDSYLGIDNIM